jgi:hypothetical protein
MVILWDTTPTMIGSTPLVMIWSANLSGSGGGTPIPGVPGVAKNVFSGDAFSG